MRPTNRHFLNLASLFLFTATVGSQAAKAGAPSLGNIVSLPDLSNVTLYEDSDNGTPAAAGSLVAYYVPVESRISRRADGSPMFAFRFLDEGSEATFALTLVAADALSANVERIKAKIAAEYHSTSDKVEIRPLPLLNTSVTMFHSSGDFTEKYLPLPNTPSSATLSFDLTMTDTGTSWFRDNVVGRGGLQFAAMQGDVELYDSFENKLERQAFRFPIYLHDVPYCAVITDACGF